MTESDVPRIPYEKWKAFRGHIQCSQLCEWSYKPAKGAFIAKPITHAGRLYFLTGGIYGTLEASYLIAWELTLRELYDESSVPAYYVYREGYEKGYVERGSMVGFVVKYNGQEYVCCKGAKLFPAPPSSSTLVTLDQAKTYHEAEKGFGCRSLWFDDRDPVWSDTAGMVFASYAKPAKDGNEADEAEVMQFLYYLDEKKLVQEVRIDDIAAVSQMAQQLHQNVSPEPGMAQMALI